MSSTLVAVLLILLGLASVGLVISKWSRDVVKRKAGRLASPEEHAYELWDLTEWRCEHGYKLSTKMRCTWPAYHAPGCPPPQHPDKKFHFGDPGDPEPIRS